MPSSLLAGKPGEPAPQNEWNSWLRADDKPSSNGSLPVTTSPPIAWTGPYPEHLLELLEGIRSRAVIPMMGLRFASTASAAFPDLCGLRSKLREGLSGEDSPDLLAVADLYASRSKLDELHNIICDQFPRNVEPGRCHTLLMSFNWDRVFTTAFDTLLEEAGSPRCLAATTDEEFESIESMSGTRTPILKLCGDIEHKPLLRATSGRLNPPSLRAECYSIYADLVEHLRSRPFLYLGYELEDPYLEYILSLLERAFPKRTLPPKPHFFVTLGFSSEEKQQFQNRYQDRLIPINLSTVDRTDEEAVFEFLEVAARYRDEPMESRHALLPGLFEKERWADAEEKAWRVPVIMSSGAEAQWVMEKYVKPVLMKIERNYSIFMVEDEASGEQSGRERIKLYERALCGIFVFGRESRALDTLVEKARHFGGRAIIVCVHEHDLGDYCKSLNHRRTDHEDVALYLENELTNVAREARLELAERYLRTGHYSSCVIHSWIAVEQSFRYVAPRICSPDQVKYLRNKPLKSYIKEFRREGYLQNVEMSDFDRLRNLRNETEHEAFFPTHSDAEATLNFAKDLVRGVIFDMQILVHELPTLQRQTAGREAEGKAERRR